MEKGWVYFKFRGYVIPSMSKFQFKIKFLINEVFGDKMFNYNNLT